MFDGILGHYPKKLQIRNCLFDTPRCDDAVQIGIDYGQVHVYRSIFLGTGPSWNQNGKGSGRFFTEECIINPGREMYVPGNVRDRHAVSRHNRPDDPHHFKKCTFFNHNAQSSSGSFSDTVLGAPGGGTLPHQWHDNLIYRVGREDRATNKLGRCFDQGSTDIRRTTIINTNPRNSKADAFYDGGSFKAWKASNDVDAIYLDALKLTEEQIMAQPNLGAVLAGRMAGAVPRSAKSPYGNLGPDWLDFGPTRVRE